MLATPKAASVISDAYVDESFEFDGIEASDHHPVFFEFGPPSEPMPGARLLTLNLDAFKDHE